MESASSVVRACICVVLIAVAVESSVGGGGAGSIAASLPVRLPYYCVRPRLGRAAARSALVRGASACA
eukprot:scaffold8509_cov119-Isochrysis_galbana.AAC.4